MIVIGHLNLAVQGRPESWGEVSKSRQSSWEHGKWNPEEETKA